MREGTRLAVTPEQHQRIHVLAEQGFSSHQIAVQLKLSKGTVYDWQKRPLGWPYVKTWTRVTEPKPEPMSLALSFAAVNDSVCGCTGFSCPKPHLTPSERDQVQAHFIRRQLAVERAKRHVADRRRRGIAA